MNIIIVIFKFLDFFVIIGFLTFVIKKYIIPMVEKALKEYGVFLYNLESDTKNLQLQSQAIYEGIEDQQLEFQAMQKKFLTWRQNCDRIKSIQEQEQVKNNQIMLQNFITRAHCMHNATIIKKEVPIILENVTCKIQEIYQQQDLQKKYIDQITQFMKESL
ncbi:MAG: hypothetical protein ACXWL2_02515 [Candidatus Chromulinivorax sp.]